VRGRGRRTWDHSSSSPTPLENDESRREKRMRRTRWQRAPILIGRRGPWCTNYGRREASRKPPGRTQGKPRPMVGWLAVVCFGARSWHHGNAVVRPWPAWSSSTTRKEELVRIIKLSFDSGLHRNKLSFDSFPICKRYWSIRYGLL
jgi:hypothetical protein